MTRILENTLNIIHFEEYKSIIDKPSVKNWLKSLRKQLFFPGTTEIP